MGMLSFSASLTPRLTTSLSRKTGGFLLNMAHTFRKFFFFMQWVLVGQFHAISFCHLSSETGENEVRGEEEYEVGTQSSQFPLVPLYQQMKKKSLENSTN